MKKRIILIGIIISLIILIGATVFSISKFGVINPFSSCFGMLQILFTDKQYTIVQNYPNRVGFSKTGDTSDKTGGELLNEYMAGRGFYPVPEEQMGGILVFSDGTEKERVLFSTNRYYSKWSWE